MIVNVRLTVTDEQRNRLARRLAGGKAVKRLATRKEITAEVNRQWQASIGDAVGEPSVPDVVTAAATVSSAERDSLAVHAELRARLIAYGADPTEHPTIDNMRSYLRGREGNR